jgi:NAD+ diphosphatase
MPQPLGFTLNPLDRSTVEGEADPLGRFEADRRALSVAIVGDDVLLRMGEDGGTALFDAADLTGADESAPLGLLDGTPVLARHFAPGAAERLLAVRGRRILDLRSTAVQGLVPAAQLGILAQAKSLFDWHARHRFCANCGAPTAPVQSRLRRDCSACAAQHFPRTDPVAIMLVARGDLCLLGRQVRFPPGTYSCLAGFISQGETLEDAVRREVLEETGVRVGAVTYQLSQPWPFPSSLMIGCAAQAETEALTIDHKELEDARWFERGEVGLMLERRHPDGLATPPPIAIAHHLLRRWYEEGSPVSR